MKKKQIRISFAKDFISKTKIRISEFHLPSLVQTLQSNTQNYTEIPRQTFLARFNMRLLCLYETHVSKPMRG